MKRLNLQCELFNFDFEVAVFELDIDLHADVSSADWHVLSQQEQKKAMAYRQHADKLRFIVTRAALKRKLAQKLQRDVAEIEVVFDKFGKPKLADGPYFNVAHSAQKALIVVSRTYDVGVDIELSEPANLLADELSHLVYSPQEKNLMSTGELCCDFVETWVAKEAVVKASGLGLHQDLSAFSVIPMSSDAVTMKAYGLKHMTDDWSGMHLLAIDMGDKYRAALCIRE